MQKIVVHRPGGYERLRFETHPTQTPGPGEVLVATRACGVNYADIAVRLGVYASARQYVGWPITPGFEFAGTVVATGASVGSVKAGDAVAGITRFGGYATHVVVPAHQVFPLPAPFGFEEAAAFPTVFMTAYVALFHGLHLRPGMNVLVHSAAGGVGTAALQLATIAGCRTVGVVGTSAKVDTARAFGASEVIDKSREDLWRRAEAFAPEGYDAVLDANGVSTMRESYRHLAPTGRLVVFGFASMLPRSGGRLNWPRLAWDYLRTPRFNPLKMTSENRSVIAFNLSFLFDRPYLFEQGVRAMLGWIGEGRLRPLPVTPYALADVAEAHRALQSGTTSGKLVLVPPGAD